MPFGVMASGKLTAEDGRLSPWLYLAQPGLIIASTGLTPGRGGPPFGYPKARTVSQFNEETPGPSVRMHRSGPVIARLPKFSSLGWGPRSSPPSLHTTLTSQLFPTEKKRRKVVLQPGIEPALLRRQCRQRYHCAIGAEVSITSIVYNYKTNILVREYIQRTTSAIPSTTPAKSLRQKF